MLNARIVGRSPRRTPSFAGKRRFTETPYKGHYTHGDSHRIVSNGVSNRLPPLGLCTEKDPHPPQLRFELAFESTIARRLPCHVAQVAR
jgi:hypothetical protein